MTKVYAVNCETLYSDASLQAVLPLLDASRRARVLRLRAPQKRAQSAAAGLLLRHLFGADAVVQYAENGKPYLLNRSATHFNLSHTENWVLCAVSPVPVGLDAQSLSSYNLKIARRWFTPEERQWALGDPHRRFTRLWTQKEAYAKMTGNSMAATALKANQAPHVIKEYTDLVYSGVYVAVCTEKNTTFSETIDVVKEPLW